MRVSELNHPKEFRVVTKKAAHPVEILRVDEIWRAEACQPCQKITQTNGRTDCPRAQPGTCKLSSNRIAGDPDERVVEEEKQAGEGDDTVPGGGSAGRRRCGQSHGKKAESLKDSPEHHDAAPAEQMAHHEHADADTDEADARLHDRVLESIADVNPRHDHEVRGVANQEP